MNRALAFLMMTVGLGGLGCAHTTPTPIVGGGAADPIDAVIRADIDLFLADSDHSVTSALNARRQAEAHISLNPVSDDTLERLSSADPWVREQALVEVIARGRPTEDAARLIVGRYTASLPFLERYYALRVMVLMREEYAGDDGAITEALLRETNDSLRATGLLVVPSLGERNGARVLAEYIRTGSPTLALKAYAVAWSVGHGFACQVRTRVLQFGRGGGQELLERIEARGGHPAFALPSAGCDSRGPVKDEDGEGGARP